MMSKRDLVPNIVRETPETVSVHCATELVRKVDSSMPTLRAVFAAAKLDAKRIDEKSWSLKMNWRTVVWGFFLTTVEEELLLRLEGRPVSGFDLRCQPQATHEAHAKGLAHLIIASSAVLLLLGFEVGIPVAAGGFLILSSWAVVHRQIGVRMLGRRLERLADDLARVIWPDGRWQISLTIADREISVANPSSSEA
jgi:hypothetical protein